MRRKRLFLTILMLVLAGVAGAAAWVAEWMSKKAIPARGGLYFPGRVVLDVPQFFQNDPQWGKDLLGPTSATLGQEGCAVASAAMVMGFYGADIDPGRLNQFVTENQGYTERGWLYWEAAAAYQPELADHVYEDLPSHYLIDRNLLEGNPVIIRLRYPSGITHFVVVVGKQGFDYLVRDPGSGGQKGIYPAREFGSPIEALRYYQKRDPS